MIGRMIGVVSLRSLLNWLEIVLTFTRARRFYENGILSCLSIFVIRVPSCLGFVLGQWKQDLRVLFLHA